MDFKLLDISVDIAATLAEGYYGIKGDMEKLPGEVDFNFYLKDQKGSYTLKITRPDTSKQYLEFQVEIIKYLTALDFPLAIPEIIQSKEGNDFISLENNRFLRLQRWVPGKMVDNIQPRSNYLLESWGKTAGLFSKYLSDFDHPGAHRPQKWNPSSTLQGRKYYDYFQNDEEREIADYFWNLFEEKTLPVLNDLRKSVNYNDAHEHNLLVAGDLEKPAISGVIDFGDALYTETINELAIACAYACMYLPDPLQAAIVVTKGYHNEFALTEDELSVLYSLISARLMLTVANAAWNKYNEPENDYLLVSEKPAWDLLRKWRRISPDFAHYRFRSACGLVPCPLEIDFSHWLDKNYYRIHPVIPTSEKKILALDLSVGSLLLGNNSNFQTINRFQKVINRILEDHEVGMAIGGYGEVRPFYSTEAYRMEGNEGSRWRTVHLGVDLWAVAGTPVFAPIEGVVFSLADNSGERNYGPTIILEHTLQSGLTFYSLFGHLSLDSIDHLKVGEQVAPGQEIGRIGAPPINGNWPSHLHFQIILDRLGETSDFPGVAYPDDADIWLSVCPDPILFFGQKNKSEEKLTDRELLSSRSEKLGRSLSISYEKPLHIVRGYLQHLYDQQGRRFLDTVNNVPHVGHQHSEVVDVAQKQIAVLNTNTRYLHENVIRFAEELSATLPPQLCVVHFVNSGSEANELALRMVEAYTGSKEMIAVEVGYHGNSNRCIEISSYKFDGKGGKGAPPHTHVVPIPDQFRGIYRDQNAGALYAEHVDQIIEELQQKNRRIGGFICESILSCGGQIVLPKDYLKNAYQSIRNVGGLCIADEVQVGFGRIGDHFWGFQLQDVVPDIVTMGKPIGNGHPLGAVVTTREVADAFANGMEYFNTFGGNPVSSAIGRKVLEIIRRDGLQEHAKVVGAYLINELKSLQTKSPLIGDVRGHGLFIGIELIKNHENIEPASAEARYLINRMRERGILMSTDGPFNNVLKIKPPMCFNFKDVDYLLENLVLVLNDTYLNK